MRKFIPSIVLLAVLFFAYKLDRNRAASDEDEYFRPLSISLHLPHYANGKLKKTKSFKSVYRQSRFDSLGFYPFIDAGLTYALHYQTRLLSKAPNRNYQIGSVKFSSNDLKSVANTLQTFQFSFPIGLSNYFDFYQIKGCDGHGNVKFSAYFTPVISASKTRNSTYFYPIYKRPSNWEGKLPTRQQIENDDALEGKGLELGYVKSRKDLYKIQLQGTAFLKYQDGSMILLSYDGDNDRTKGDENVVNKKATKKKVNKKSTTIIEEQLLVSDEDSTSIEVSVAPNAIAAEAEESGMSTAEIASKYPTIEEDLEDSREEINTDSTDNVLIEKEIDEESISKNPNYVFFKKSNEHLQSSSGMPLTPFSTIATDKRYIPTGAILLAAVPVVDKNENCKSHALQFVLAQDTGGGIRGTGHVDWYVGKGDKAEKFSNTIHHYGQLWLVLPKKKAGGKLTSISSKSTSTTKKLK